MAILVNLDVLMAERKLAVGELAAQVGITPANLSILKNGRAKAVRFSTLAALCQALDCQPGDILAWRPRPDEVIPGAAAPRRSPAPLSPAPNAAESGA
jgi:putative transcriptional regulator